MNTPHADQPWSPIEQRAEPMLCGRAAVYLWWLAAVEMGLSGLGALLMVAASAVPVNELTAELPADQIELFLEIRPLLIPLALGVLVLGFVPGLAYAVLGFAVRTGRRWAINTALVLSATQLLVAGVLCAFAILGAIVTLDPVAVTVSVLFYGSPTLLLAFCVRLLMASRRTTRATSMWEDEGDPWSTDAA